MHSLPTPDFLYDWLPVCSAAFPYCGLLLRVVPPPTGLSSVAAAALACVFCLITVGAVQLLKRASTALEVVGWLIGYCLIGGVFSLVIAAALFNMMTKSPFGFDTAADYVKFFAGISYLFAYIRHAKLSDKDEEALKIAKKEP